MTALPRIWRLGDDVDTDQLAPFDTLTADWATRRDGILRARPDFARDAVAGDILVAGRNFGCGSSREAAAENLQRLGLAAVIALSFGRVFRRNAVALAFPCYTVARLHGLEDGAVATLDRDAAELRGGSTTVKLDRWAPVIAQIYAAGGLEAMLQQRIRTGASA